MPILAQVVSLMSCLQMLAAGSGIHIAGDNIYCPPIEAGPSRLPPDMRELHQFNGSTFLALQVWHPVSVQVPECLVQ
jgi:hypothetical protein